MTNVMIYTYTRFKEVIHYNFYLLHLENQKISLCHVFESSIDVGFSYLSMVCIRTQYVRFLTPRGRFFLPRIER